MTKFHPILRYMILGLILTLSLNGCALYDRFFGKSEEKSPEELMSQGMNHFEKGDYQTAAENFQTLKDRYPYDKSVVLAELKIADSLYYQSEYEAAFDAYDEFERLHPRDKNIPYVIYQKGMSNFSQVKGPDRDQAPTRKAKEEFERLVKRFPKDAYANNARKNLRECLINLAEHEIYVGHFYFKMGKYRAAMNRFTYIIHNYPDMGQYYEALEYISKCKEKLSSDTE